MADQRVAVVPWDQVWAERFADQRPGVEIALADLLTRPVEHIGSTSVPGLASKPVVDMLATVSSLKVARARVRELTQAGWLFWPDDPNRDYRLWFLRPRPEARSHHLQIIQDGDPHAVALIAFRDALRRDESLLARYAALKRQLASQHQEDRNAYTNAKSDFVEGTLRSLGIEPPGREAV